MVPMRSSRLATMALTAATICSTRLPLPPRSIATSGQAPSAAAGSAAGGAELCWSIVAVPWLCPPRSGQSKL
ncbi:hypothetical protein [Rugamonas sp. DEMB1]|uniref:hypothetical protein n=1 Tax=Rugamonas sp. DEMB1 TaxID=3039386 RepID=UPI00244D5487|nr:hypothetical protein [Rugamonas sp. DEMB1]WGG53648.1 hypothetical protein QC826_23725 [Rugamonas sp. DEMB1]